jgi:hypothetical protein
VSNHAPDGRDAIGGLWRVIGALWPGSGHFVKKPAAAAATSRYGYRFVETGRAVVLVL